MTVDINTAMLLGIAAFNAVTAIVVWNTHNAVNKSNENIQKIEIATNSMKDALVRATAVAAHAEGKEEGRVQAAAEASKT